jgi:hypothetical protein
MGVIGVLDTARALEHCAVLDLAHDSLAVQAERQLAYAVRQCDLNLCNYKDPVCCERIGLTWFSFGRRSPHVGDPTTMDGITDSRSDAVAEWMKERVHAQRGMRSSATPEIDHLLRTIETRLS